MASTATLKPRNLETSKRRPATRGRSAFGSIARVASDDFCSRRRLVLTPRQILHVDMDAFFASVEQRDNPALRGKPVLVGGLGGRSVVCAASYEARPFGVHSAMPMAVARRKCPHAVVVEPRRGRYEQVSSTVFSVFRRYTPLVEGLSLDEAFLDVTRSQSLFGSGAEIAECIRADIYRETALTASAGVATTKFAAKIASDMNKPNGITCVPDDVVGFLAKLPIRRMWGIGPKQEPRFLALGLRTFADLQTADPHFLRQMLGVEGLRHQDLALGIDPREVIPDAPSKSFGAERTYDEDLRCRESVATQVLLHAERVSRRLLEHDLSATHIIVKLKYADFSVLTRRNTVGEPVNDTDSIYASCIKSLQKVSFEGKRIRLVGVSVSGLAPSTRSATLFPDRAREKRERLEKVLLAAGNKTGVLITRATLLGKQ
jgi:DNA polymerase IV